MTSVNKMRQTLKYDKICYFSPWSHQQPCCKPYYKITSSVREYQSELFLNDYWLTLLYVFLDFSRWRTQYCLLQESALHVKLSPDLLSALFWGCAHWDPRDGERRGLNLVALGNIQGCVVLFRFSDELSRTGYCSVAIDLFHCFLLSSTIAPVWWKLFCQAKLCFP